MSTLIANQHIPVDASAGAVPMALPTSAAAGDEVSVEKYDSSLNPVTITGNIRGTTGASITLALARESVTLRAKVSGGTTSWWPTAGHKTLTSLDGRFAQQGQIAALFSVDDISSGTAGNVVIGTGLTVLSSLPAVVVWPEDFPQRLVWGNLRSNVSAGNGFLGSYVRETTSGTAANIGSPFRGVSGGFVGGALSAAQDLMPGELPLGVVTAPRVFKLYEQIFRDSGSWTATHSGGLTTGVRPFFRAERAA